VVNILPPGFSTIGTFSVISLLAVGELERIIGKIEFDERYNDVVVLKNEKNHYVCIYIFEEKIIGIEWLIGWFEE
jgi:hypothetical protein